MKVFLVWLHPSDLCRSPSWQAGPQSGNPHRAQTKSRLGRVREHCKHWARHRVGGDKMLGLSERISSPVGIRLLFDNLMIYDDMITRYCEKCDDELPWQEVPRSDKTNPRSWHLAHFICSWRHHPGKVVQADLGLGGRFRITRRQI